DRSRAGRSRRSSRGARRRRRHHGRARRRSPRHRRPDRARSPPGASPAGRDDVRRPPVRCRRGEGLRPAVRRGCQGGSQGAREASARPSDRRYGTRCGASPLHPQSVRLRRPRRARRDRRRRRRDVARL
ncbi:MAG: hypothetical protein AVDCRST_MAG45-2495, partial [uncultured Solirubrobacterales bacterium]